VELEADEPLAVFDFAHAVLEAFPELLFVLLVDVEAVGDGYHATNGGSRHEELSGGREAIPLSSPDAVV
jgi:hypothetical protein